MLNVFSDEVDARRVLNALVDAGLVSNDGATRSIWYKSDVYTHLGLSSDNEYGLRCCSKICEEIRHEKRWLGRSLARIAWPSMAKAP